MKKHINVLLIALTLVLFISPILFAQADPPAVEQTEIAISSPQDTFVEYFASLAGLAVLTLSVTQWVKKGLEALKFVLQGTVAGLLSWVIAILLCAAGYFFSFGILAGVQWYFIFIYGIAVGLVANGLFALEHVKVFLEAIKLSPKKAVK